MKIRTLKGKVKIKKLRRISWNPTEAEKVGYPHFMLKEIYEQPRVIEETIRGRISEERGKIYLEEEIGLKKEELKRIDRIIITACGTSWHAGLVGEYLLEEYCRIPVEVEYASEFRYRNPIIDQKTLIMAISQSGETADTLGAVKEIRKKGARVISICNVMGSSLTQLSDGVIYIPEVSVPLTPILSVVPLQLLAYYIAIKRGHSPDQPRNLAKSVTVE